MKAVKYILSAFVLLLCGCAHEEIEGIGNNGFDTVVKEIPLSLIPADMTGDSDMKSVDSSEKVTTVDGVQVADGTISDVWVLEYDHQGNVLITGCNYYSGEDIPEYGQPLSARLAVPLGSASYTIVLLANTHDPDLFDNGVPSLLGDLKKFTKTINSEGDLFEHVPGGRTIDLMMNAVSEVTSDAVTEGVACHFYRNVARLNLTITNSLHSQMTINSVQIKNVPKYLYYADLYNHRTTASDYTSDAFPADTATFTKLPAKPEPMNGGTGIAPGETKDLTYYFPRNCRGISGSATNLFEKNTFAPENALYVEIVATLNLNKQKVYYRFYPGGDETTDFNVRPNYSYNIPVIFRNQGDVTVDSRINYFTLDILSPPDEFTEAAGSGTFTVRSYKTNLGVSEQSPWTIEYEYEENGVIKHEKPDWITSIVNNTSAESWTQEGGEECTLTVSAAPLVTEADYQRSIVDDADAMRAATPRGSDTAPWNLSNPDGGMDVVNTANCYVINSPGHYCLPLVYGNAYENGANNVRSYLSEYATSDTYMGHFVTSEGIGIASPFIQENKTSAGAYFTGFEALHLWIDVNAEALNCIHNVSIIDGSMTLPTLGEPLKYIKFEITEQITPANAVIAVRDSRGIILWSWHLWFTNENIYETTSVTSSKNVQYDFMPVNLGWITNGVSGAKYYDAKNCKIKITQTESGISKEFVVNRARKDVTRAAPYGDNTLYQYGRKDPMIAANKDRTGVKINYAPDSKYKPFGGSKYGIGFTTFSATSRTKFPHEPMLYLPDSSKVNYWNDTNFWDMYQTQTLPTNDAVLPDRAIQKTVYDPTPIGFTVPHPNIRFCFSRPAGDLHFYTDDSESEVFHLPVNTGFYYRGYTNNYGSGGRRENLLYFYANTIYALSCSIKAYTGTERRPNCAVMVWNNTAQQPSYKGLSYFDCITVRPIRGGTNKQFTTW